MRLLFLEVNEGDSTRNVEIFSSQQFNDFEIVVRNLGETIQVSPTVPLHDYFEYLQSIPEEVPADVINSVTGEVLDEIRTFDYIFCPVGVDGRDAVLGYAMSWVMMYLEYPLKVVYYGEKLSPNVELLEDFRNLYEFTELTTTHGDILFLDMPDKFKNFFKRYKRVKGGNN